MRVSGLKQGVEEHFHKQLVSIGKFVDNIPDYEYNFVTPVGEDLVVSIDFNLFPEVINAFGTMGWAVSVSKDAGNVIAHANKVIDGKPFRVTIVVATYKNGVDAVKEKCGDWVKFG